MKNLYCLNKVRRCISRQKSLKHSYLVLHLFLHAARIQGNNIRQYEIYRLSQIPYLNIRQVRQASSLIKFMCICIQLLGSYMDARPWDKDSGNSDFLPPDSTKKNADDLLYCQLDPLKGLSLAKGLPFLGYFVYEYACFWLIYLPLLINLRKT